MLNLLCADLRTVIPTLAENSVDAVITDPPYNIGETRRIVDMRKRDKREIGKDFSHFENLIYPDEWLPLVLRVLRPGGS